MTACAALRIDLIPTLIADGGNSPRNRGRARSPRPAPFAPPVLFSPPGASDSGSARPRGVSTPDARSIGRKDRGLTRGFCELTLEARDPEALAAFYTDVFGWEELSRQPDRVWLGCGEWSRLGLWSRGEKEFGDEGGRHVHFALSVHPGQLAELIRELSRRGIRHEGPVEHDGGDRSVYFEDPEGNVVEAWDFFERGAGLTRASRR